MVEDGLSLEGGEYEIMPKMMTAGMNDDLLVRRGGRGKTPQTTDLGHVAPQWGVGVTETEPSTTET
jgi:hypothetical protein